MQFILVPDAQAGFTVREFLARENVVNVIVGTFTALIDLMQEAWLLPNDEQEEAFQQNLIEALPKVTGAFWLNSFQVDDVNTATVIERNLAYMLEALPLATQFQPISSNDSRIVRYFNDFVKLHELMGQARPLPQSVATKWFEQYQTPSLFNIDVISLIDTSLLSPWQQQVLNALNETRTQYSSEHEYLKEKLANLDHVRDSNNVLQTFAKQLFTDNSENELDIHDQLFITRCRDSLQEVELVVTKIQQLIATKKVDADSIAVLMPNDQYWQNLLAKMLSDAGIATSNHLAQQTKYQWDIQLIKDCLTLYANSLNNQTIAPMQYAAILTSPLMPWSQGLGQYFAETVFSGNIDLLIEKEECGSLVNLLIKPTEQPVFEWIQVIIEMLAFPKDGRITSKANLIENIANLKLEEIKGPKENSDALSRVINRLKPTQFQLASELPRYQLNSILLLTEDEVLMKPVTYLFMVGFNQGNYEFNTRVNSIYNADNWLTLAELSQLNLNHHQTSKTRKQLAFKQTLAHVTQQLMITLSSFDLSGETVNVSETLADIAFCVQAPGKVKPETLIKQLDSSFLNELNQIKHTKSAQAIAVPKQINLDKDLLASNVDKDGNVRPESPSSLSQIMLSPLAWWLNRNHLTIKTWPLEELTIMLKGTLAHKVFELFFKNNYQDVDTVFEQLFIQAIQEDASFLEAPRWRLERSQLSTEIYQALVPFVQWCTTENWHNIATEEKLSGTLFGLAVRGEADAIFETPEHTLILDYKTSKSDGRIKPLESGYELQTKVYRELYSQVKQQSIDTINSGYLTLKDSTLLCNQPIITKAAGASTIKIADISQYGTAQSEDAEILIQQRIEQLQQGIIQFNTNEDEKEWDQRGHKLQYVFEQYPLVKLFLYQTQSNEEGAADE